jgi:hypothetical protein
MAASTAIFLMLTTACAAALVVLTAIYRRRDIQAELDIAREALRRAHERLQATQAQLDALDPRHDTAPIPPVPPATPEEGLPA